MARQPVSGEGCAVGIMATAEGHTPWSLPGSSVHGILQARILEWVVILFSRGSAQHRGRTQVSCIAGGFFTTESPGKSHFVCSYGNQSLTTYTLTLVFRVLGGESTLS